MSDMIVIRPSPGEAGCTWMVDGGAVDAGELGAAAAVADGRPAVVLVPGTEVLLARVRLAVRNRERARAAIPWALEDRLAADVDGLHFALGRFDGEQWPVAVVARGLLDDLLARCTAAGLDVRAVVPEPLALPLPGADAWSVLEESGRVTVRMDADAGFACEPTLLPVVAGAAGTPARVSVQRAAGTEPPEWPAAFAGTGASDASECRQALAAFTEAGRPRINLLQGSYSRAEQRLEMLRRWRVPGGLAVALLAVVGIQALLAYADRGEREAELRERIQTVYQQAFPEARATRDPRAQMEARLRVLRGTIREDESRFAETVLRAGEVITAHDDARLTGLSWREGLLELHIEAARLPDLDAIQRGLGDRGMGAELRGVDRDEDGVSGRLRVTRDTS